MALAEYGDAFNIDTDANGDPILIDAASGQAVATYDRTEGAWVYGDIISDSVNTESATVTNEVDAGSVNTEEALIERYGNLWIDAGQFDSLNDAQNFGLSNDIKRFFVPEGIYEEKLDVDEDGEVWEGVSRELVTIRNESGRAISTTGDGVEIRNLTAEGNISTGGGIEVEAGSRTICVNCSFEAIIDDNLRSAQVASSASEVGFYSCIIKQAPQEDDEDITIFADNCHILGCTVFGAIRDSGSNNSIPDNGNGNVIV